MNVNLSDIKLPGSKEEPDKNLSQEEYHKKNFDKNIDVIKHEIELKIIAMNKKIERFHNKESILDKMISMTNQEIESLSPNEFTRRGQKQAVLLKQLEALSVLNDTILKYEDSIQKYNKMIIDIENNKLKNFISINAISKEEKTDEMDLKKLLVEVQELMKASSENPSTNQGMLSEIEAELIENNYN